MKRTSIHSWGNRGLSLGFRLALETAQSETGDLWAGLSEWGKQALYMSKPWDDLERAGNRLFAVARAALTPPAITQLLAA